MEKHDLIIIGGSAAAVAAGIYAARRNMDFKIISKDFGGEVATSGEIGNYPGVPNSNGIELADKFKEHLEVYGIKPEIGIEVKKITKQDDGTFCVFAKTGKDSKMAAERLPNGGNGAPICDYIAKAILMTTGVHPRELNVLGEKEFRNKGVSYCTTCDGPIFAGKITATIGGGNSGLESAIMLSDIAEKVYVVTIDPDFTGDQILVDKLKTKNNVEIIFDASATEILGNEFVTGLKYKGMNSPAGEEKEIKLDGIFVHIGMKPNSKIAPENIELDKFGQIIVGKNCETDIPGFFAAGDVTDIPFKQIVMAAGQGVCALLSVADYLNRTK